MSSSGSRWWGIAAGLTALGFAWAQTPEKPKATPITKPQTPIEPEWFAPYDLEQEIRASLPAKVSLDYRELPLDKVFDELRTQWQVGIVVDNDGLDDANVGPKQRITFRATDVDPRVALQRMLTPLGLAFHDRNGELYISSHERIRDQEIQKLYPVADLAAAPKGDGYENHSAVVIWILKETVERDVWYDNGGDSDILFEPTTLSLFVVAPKRAHDRIPIVLAALRRQVERTEAFLKRLGRPPLRDLRGRFKEPERPLIPPEPKDSPRSEFDGFLQRIALEKLMEDAAKAKTKPPLPPKGMQ